MNKEFIELRNKLKELNTKIYELDEELFPIRYFINERGEYFKKKESIKALNIIREDIIKMEELIKEKEEERDKITEMLIDKCNHPIIINKQCPLCGDWFYQIPDTSSIALEIPSLSDHILIRSLCTNLNIKYDNEYLNKIINIIEKSISEEDTLGYFKDTIEELQYDKNIKIRRLKR